MPAESENDDRMSDDAQVGGGVQVLSASAPTAVSGETQARVRRGRADAVLVAAVDVARAAAQEVAEAGAVGDHQGVVAEEERVVSHRFACLSTGYLGWSWTVTLARVPRGKVATVSEVTLLPGEQAIVSPEWLPWSQRLAPGDLAPGMVLPRVVDDVRLEAGFEATGAEDVDAFALWELGLGRHRVLSREGREDAAQRWYDGVHGPHDSHAEQASATCASCGFFIPMAGALRQVFGVCANEWSPSDGQVVSLDHGCGAHSEVDVEPRSEAVDAPVLDDLVYDVVPTEAVDVPPTDGTGAQADLPAHVPSVEPSQGRAAVPTNELGDESGPALSEEQAPDPGPAPEQ